MALEGVYIIGVLASSVLGIGVSVWLYSDETAVSTRLFVALVALHSVVGFLVVGQLLAPDPVVVAIYGVQKAVAAGLMPLWFLFALTYTRHPNRLSRPAVSTVGGYYLLLALLEVSNPVHGLLRSNYETAGSLIPHLLGTTTFLYSLISLPLALFYLGGLSLVGIHALSGPTVSRQNSAFLFVGFLPPFFVLIADIYRRLPGPVDGGIVLLSTWSLAAVAWGVFRYREFDLLPLARETVFKVIEDAVIVVDDDLRLLDYNDAATEEFARLNGKQGTALADLIPALVEDTGDGDPFATSFTDDDGVRHYETTVAPLEAGGEIRGYGLLVRDVTENRTYMESLEQQTERLERFASTLSHDLRNPLNVAKLRTDMVVREYNDENAEIVEQTLDRMETMIDDLLILARSGQTVETTESVRLIETASEAWNNADVGDSGLDLSVPPGTTLQADRDRLLHVFENLFRNAADHNDPPLTVRVGTLRDSATPSDGSLEPGFFVEDDGEGIPEDEHDNIFEHGYTTSDDGTGFGLSIVHDIVAAHGWEIRVADGTDGGARFEIIVTDINH